MPPYLSIVIPLGPGEPEAAGLLDQLHSLPVPAELILATTSQPPEPWPLPVTTIDAGPNANRAHLLNAGAAQASGAWLWFLHADTRLLPGALPALAAFIARDRPLIGWFHLTFRPDGPRLTRLNAIGANLRSRYLGIPFGDQALLVPADRFRALGGFDETAPYGEDHLFIWTARAAGLHAAPVGATVATSARKYARLGWLHTTLLHWRLTVEQAWPAWRSSTRPRP